MFGTDNDLKGRTNKVKNQLQQQMQTKMNESTEFQHDVRQNIQTLGISQNISDPLQNVLKLTSEDDPQSIFKSIQEQNLTSLGDFATKNNNVMSFLGLGDGTQIDDQLSKFLSPEHKSIGDLFDIAKLNEEENGEFLSPMMDASAGFESPLDHFDQEDRHTRSLFQDAIPEKDQNISPEKQEDGDDLNVLRCG